MPVKNSDYYVFAKKYVLNVGIKDFCVSKTKAFFVIFSKNTNKNYLIY